MTDLSYNIETQDWDFVDGDFVVTDNVNVQNGGIILYFRAFNSSDPILGIGINQVRGSSILQTNYEFNRWKNQVNQDGGEAQVKYITQPDFSTQFQWQVNYG